MENIRILNMSLFDHVSLCLCSLIVGLTMYSELRDMNIGQMMSAALGGSRPLVDVRAGQKGHLHGHGHGHAAWAWTCSIGMRIDTGMQQHGLGHE